MSNSISTIAPRSGGGAATTIDSADRISESYADYLSDESRFGPARAEKLILATGESHISEALSSASAAGTEVTVSAGRTGIVGGAVPNGGTLLSLAGMRRLLGMRRLEDGGFVLRAEPGITVAELAERLETKELGIEEPGIPPEEREALEAFLADRTAYFYPPDPTEDTAHLGGTVATNASGARSFEYGATREHVHGLRVCLASGEVLDVDRGACVADGRKFEINGASGAIEVAVPGYEMPSTKSAAGYFARPDMDLVDLFVGSEGTLGVLSEVRIALTPRPDGILSALAFFSSDDDAVAFVQHARGDRSDLERPAVTPLALEFFDSRSLDFLRERKAEEGSASEIPELPDYARSGILFEQAYAEDELFDLYEAWEALLAAHGSSMEQTWGGLEQADLARLKALRHGVAEQVNGEIARAQAIHPEIHKIGTDAAVPSPALDEMFAFLRRSLEDTGLRHVVFGHIGDNHLHMNMMPGDVGELRLAKQIATAIAERAVALGGTVSAEHGIGKLKHDFLRIMYGDSGLAEMASVKRALDPACVLNRGVMFPERLLACS